MTFDDLLTKLTDVLDSFCDKSRNFSSEPHPEAYKNFPFMKQYNEGYTWHSTKESKHSIMVRDKFLLIGPDANTLFLQIDDAMPDNFDNEKWTSEYNYNVMYVQDSDACFAVQRHSTSEVMLVSEEMGDDLTNAIIFDMNTVTEDEWFQYSLLFEIPTYEVMKATKPFFNKMKEISSSKRIELTLYIGAELDVNNLVHYKEEDFK